MALYTKEELNYERSIGLQMTDAENEECIEITGEENLPRRYSAFLNQIRREEWTEERHEQWLEKRMCPKWIADDCRKKFKGFVYIDWLGNIGYEK